MNIILIDTEKRHEYLYKNFFPFDWKIDYNCISNQNYDIVFIDCDICKLSVRL